MKKAIALFIGIIAVVPVIVFNFILRPIGEALIELGEWVMSGWRGDGNG